MTESNNNAQSMAERLSALMDNSAEQSTQDNGSADAHLFDQECLEQMCADEELKGQWARYHLIRDVIQDDFKAPLSPDFASNLSELIAAEPALDCSALASMQGVSETNSNVVSLADRKLAQEVNQQQEANQQQGAAEANGAESSSHAKVVAPASGWRRATTGFAIAASVAMVSLVGLNTMQNSDTPIGSQTAENETVPAVQGGESSSVILAEQPVIVVPAGESQLEFVANTGTFWVNGDTANGSGMSKAGEQRLNMFLSEHIEHSPTSDVRGMIPYSRLAGYDAVRPVSPDNTEAGTEQ